MKLYGIAACDTQGGMGYQGTLPWDLPQEKAFFRKQTLHQTLIMGHTTYLGLPQSLLLNRDFIVLTKTNKESLTPHLFYARDDLESLQLAKQFPRQKSYVIGGSLIFNLFFSKKAIYELYLTFIPGTYLSDTFFPLHYLKDALQKTLFYKEKGFEVFRYVFSEEKK